MPKLIRAEVPMCPLCGTELAGMQYDQSCPDCDYADDGSGLRPHWGYYAPDVEGVVGGLRAAADVHHGNEGDYVTIDRHWLLRWADILEGANE